ncbi:hypothetical protein [Pinibacter soli]|uniref:SHOCT domain-containing protein n=1 Tax=Pinibacter soli TaxID=3044211 RepID=A0ABT6R9A2_9BACT|nr:hypothetical protein [Pinibacter soli]MDI3319144.1 hypothetical protein [Pinibacter soli]
MGTVIIWIALSFIIAFFGSNKKIGFLGSLLISLLLSPIVGFIVTLLSKDLQTDKAEKLLLEKQRQHDFENYKPSNKDFENIESAFKAKLITNAEYDRIVTRLKEKE